MDASSQPSQPTPPHDDRTRKETVAQLAYEQTAMLWEDEVAYADTLRDKRRTYATGLIVLAGLGIFRLNWTRSANDVPVIENEIWQATLKALLTLALVLFLFSTYLLFTERPVISSLLLRCAPRRAAWIGRLKRSLGFMDRVAFPEADFNSSPSTPARRKLELSARALALVHKASVAEVWRYRHARLRAAYDQLALANSRVNHRIETGVLTMLLGYGLLAVIFIVYTFTA